MCKIVPTGVFIASITESGILCVLLINSTSKYLPNFIFCPCVTSTNVELLKILCSSNLFLINPIASFGAYTGIFICFNKYGTLPIWSSCPCVIINPLIFSSFLCKYVISGITKSTPSISSSGNDKPQSTTIISSSYSNTVMFFPTSWSPPSGIIFNFGFLNIISFFLVFLSAIALSPLTTSSFDSTLSCNLFSLVFRVFLTFLVLLTFFVFSFTSVFSSFIPLLGVLVFFASLDILDFFTVLTVCSLFSTVSFLFCTLLFIFLLGTLGFFSILFSSFSSAIIFLSFFVFRIFRFILFIFNFNKSVIGLKFFHCLIICIFQHIKIHLYI